MLIIIIIFFFSIEECQTESNPAADHYWLSPNNDPISSYSNSINSIMHKKRHRLHKQNDIDKPNNQTQRKYQIRLKKTIQFRFLFQLHINHVTHEDAGQYVCQLSNLLGEARSAIQLKGMLIF